MPNNNPEIRDQEPNWPDLSQGPHGEVRFNNVATAAELAGNIAVTQESTEQPIEVHVHPQAPATK